MTDVDTAQPEQLACRPVSSLLETVLSELTCGSGRPTPLEEACIASVECALQLTRAAARARRAPADERLSVDAREALGAARASVLAATCAVRSIEDRRRGLPWREA
ncbi:hypothetical protein [Streptomyces fulvorobeus]|uniref:Uncharacterized protein n=1 Tax=Streptomyces fulvorobeus TaxID=284028 RepID=A0A7J0C0T3_9ACTN|nr:hypothetical protein [Streptomyces fulvorobeus]NYE39849.1 hypothetical protein [Streptomyces fulvorobeus]GFM96102.1 hypothetical protein Sfulv_09130 [Streptomyces fulvorobeus]